MCIWCWFVVGVESVVSSITNIHPVVAYWYYTHSQARCYISKVIAKKKSSHMATLEQSSSSLPTTSAAGGLSQPRHTWTTQDDDDDDLQWHSCLCARRETLFRSLPIQIAARRDRWLPFSTPIRVFLVGEMGKWSIRSSPCTHSPCTRDVADLARCQAIGYRV